MRMSQPPGQIGNQTPRDSSLSGWHYLLIFTAFGLVVLVLVSSRYQRLQARKEQRFQGIEQLQRHAPDKGSQSSSIQDRAGQGTGSDAEGNLSPPDTQQPLIVTLRPLMLI